jgi:hypothetical protein
VTLRDEDEFLHRPTPGGPANWQENMFFICWDLRTTTGVLCHVQRVSDRDIQEARTVVVVGGRAASANLEGPYSPVALVDGVTAEPVIPFRRWRFRAAGTGHVGTGRLGFYAEKGSDDTTFSFDLQLESILPVADFAEGLAAIVAGMRADARGPQMGDQQHYEQGGTWQGRIRVGNHEVEADGLFVRDHSWGVRKEHSRFQAFWTASCLDEGRLFGNAIGIPRGEEVLGVGAVADPSGVTFTQQVTAAFEPEPGIASYQRTAVTYGAPVSRRLTATTQFHIPIALPHSGPGRYDNNAISAVRMGDATGFGVMEWAATEPD